MMVRTRFAPSPTGHVHIGNIRTAIYSWLVARNQKGQFLLRIEDTDLERSTPEAIKTMLDAMAWLGLDYDAEPEYQSRKFSEHKVAAEHLMAAGAALGVNKGGDANVVQFRIPWNTEDVPFVRDAGNAELKLHPETPVLFGPAGVSFALVSSKGKPAQQESSLAGFMHLRLFNDAGREIFALDDHVQEILAGGSITIQGAARASFQRREAVFNDLVKGEMAKALDAMRDFVIIRSNGSPVFHLANVVDDLSQNITHIIRGDDHVENTFRHLFLFHALGRTPPLYAHLPMIVNQQGKPYSKRDGDAFVSDFKKQGYLPEAFFNYLVLLGWSPGDDREIMSRTEMVECFDLAKVKSSPAQMDLKKLLHINGEYLRLLPRERLVNDARVALQGAGVDLDGVADAAILKVLRVMGDRIRITSELAEQALFFFTEQYSFDPKAVEKRLKPAGVPELLRKLDERFAVLPAYDAASLEAALQGLAGELGLKNADLVHPLRVAVSGLQAGPGLYEMLEILGRDRVAARIKRALTLSSDAQA